MGTPLIATKVMAPRARAGLLTRPRLTRLLAESPARLTLIVAPAGFGKTTLIAEYQALVGDEFAWVFFDDGDNDPLLFWRYVVSAIRRVVPSFGRGLEGSMRSVGGMAVEAVVARILNDLARLDRGLTLVLDDYQAITEVICHSTLSTFIERMPPNVRVILLTRASPPLPLGRLRATGDLLEVRAADLAFRKEETTDLLERVLGLELPEASLATLHERTEGWPAGLYLAYLSLRAADDPSVMVEQFGGSNRYVADYFGQVVLAAQGRAQVGFLLDTSILRRMCGPLCDALTGRSDSARVLVELEKHNLFLIPLDDRREWFRYHHLFGGLLRDELQRTAPERLSDLHKRAGEWWAAAGHIDEAVPELVESGDLPAAAGLVAMHWVVFFKGGRARTIRRWLDMFPREYTATDARLSLVEAWLYAFERRRDKAVRAIKAARAAGHDGELLDGTGTLEEGVTMLRATFLWSDVQGQLAAAAVAYRRAAERGSSWQAAAAVGLGSALVTAGRHSEARGPLERAVKLQREVGEEDVFACNALGMLARVALAEGDGDEAARWAGAMREMAEAHGYFDLPWAGSFDVVLGLISERSGDLAEAERCIVRGVERLRDWEPLRLAEALVELTRVQRAVGKHGEAAAALDEARDLVAGCRSAGAVQARLDDLTRRAPRRRRVSSSDDLTQQEMAVLDLLGQGLTKREVAERLVVSYNTVHSHTKSIYRKLGCSSRAEVVAEARERGLISG